MTLWAFQKENLPIVLDAVLRSIKGSELGEAYSAPKIAAKAFKFARHEDVTTCFWVRTGGTLYVDIAKNGEAQTYPFRLGTGRIRMKRTVEAVKIRGYYQNHWYPKSYDELKEEFGCVNKRTA